MSAFAERAVPFATCFNFRDMGGWRTTDGRELKWHTLYRADTLHRLHGEELELLTSLGLRTIVDLRSANELEVHGRFRHVGDDVCLHHIPLVDEAGPSANRPPASGALSDSPRSLGDAYTAMATRGQESIARAVGTLCEPGALPAVFHCTAGKDRTGILAAILLSAVGVRDEEILEDYALTAESRAARYAWLAVHDPDYLAFLQTLPPEALEVRSEAIQVMLDHLRADHGTVAEYLTGGGLPIAALDRFAYALVTN
jgi:protein-tyrosine phosphatase